MYIYFSGFINDLKGSKKMYKIKTFLVASVFIFSCGQLSYAKSPSCQDKEEYSNMKVQTAPQYNPGTLKHIVLFKFKPEVTKEQVKEVIKQFSDLKDLCLRNGQPYIQSVESGFANSHEGADQGLELGFIVTFNSEGDRNYYVGQPFVDEKYTDLYDQAHLKFKQFVGPLLATPVVPNGVLVFDFNVEQEN